MTVALRLPVVPASGNRVLRAHWARRRRWADELKLLTVAAVLAAERRHARGLALPQDAPRCRRVTLTRVADRALDVDNLALAFKPVLDALVQTRVLHDDSPRWAQVRYAQRHPADGEAPGALVEVEVADAGPRREGT